ncbi:MAG TPA: type IV toxin-antitoxin system AbiEi family antitoxin [Micromonosporaceae bacterium]
MNSSLLAVAARNGGVVSISDCYAAGLTFAEIGARCRSGEFSRLMRGAYLLNADLRNGPSRADLVRAAVASFGASAVVGLQTAAELHGIGGAPASSRIHIITPRTAGRGRRILDTTVSAHQFELLDEDVNEIGGIRVTTPARTLMDLVCCLDRMDAVAVADSCLNRGLVTEDDVAAVSGRLRRRRGAVLARRALAEADGRAESPLESRVRLRAVDGKVAPDELQYVVRRADGLVIARCDFAWTGYRLVGEADGVGPHTTPDAVLYDRKRQNAIQATGLQVVRFTWADTVAPEVIPRAIRAAMRAPAMS